VNKARVAQALPRPAVMAFWHAHNQDVGRASALVRMLRLLLGSQDKVAVLLARALCLLPMALTLTIVAVAAASVAMACA